ncbi:response regulator [Paraburkholderia phosphatilytica]|uniref:response regulator n=1 Tax=Paraburkholderia phosphatilytica TaxID=2282883 RepID=UPI000E4F3B2F|nr:response regulator transcription factor [Paraburkholderia phosphatilytica]
MTSPITVFLIEDDASMRAEFERMIVSHASLTLAGSAGSVAEARQKLRGMHPEVAIVDLGLPDGDGADLIALLRATSPATAVLVSTIFGDEAHVVRAIEAGARGYLLKDTTIDEFARSILLVKNGDSPLSPQVARHLLKRFAPVAQAGAPRAAKPDSEAGQLTAREIDILKSISHGFSTAETAAKLQLSPHTVTTHIKNIYGKLSVNSRVQALNEARLKGLIP